MKFQKVYVHTWSVLKIQVMQTWLTARSYKFNRLEKKQKRIPRKRASENKNVSPDKLKKQYAEEGLDTMEISLTNGTVLLLSNLQKYARYFVF